ncbi:MAG TPA: hypothetical protein VF406_17380 [Thermodesulfobacteriota bacterium]
MTRIRTRLAGAALGGLLIVAGAPAWAQDSAGLGLALSPTVTLFGGYAFFATADPTIEGTDIEYTTHNAEFGLRLAF